MKKFNATLVTGDGVINVVIDGKSYTANKEHVNYRELKAALVSNDADAFVRYHDTTNAVQNYVRDSVDASSVSSVEVREDGVYYKGKLVHNAVAVRIMQLKKGGFPFAPLVRFLEKLEQNPSYHSVEQLYRFLEHKALPITEDGDVLAYKTVRSDYLDKYSGTFNNKPGNVCEIPRNEVDDDPTQHCSVGLHVGALDYAGPNGWYHREGDRVVIVKFNPRDAVSVPNDHSFQKLRVNRYEVVADYEKPLEDALYSATSNKVDVAKSTVPDVNVFQNSENLHVSEIGKGQRITFVYKEKRRFGEVDKDNGIFFRCFMVAPDEATGEYRNFTKVSMSDVRVYA